MRLYSAYKALTIRLKKDNLSRYIPFYLSLNTRKSILEYPFKMRLYRAFKTPKFIKFKKFKKKDKRRFAPLLREKSRKKV